jgi:hypothetical protein
MVSLRYAENGPGESLEAIILNFISQSWMFSSTLAIPSRRDSAQCGPERATEAQAGILRSQIRGFVPGKSEKKSASVSHLVTRHLVQRLFFLQKRLNRFALTDANGTTGFQTATRGRIERKYYLSLQR